MSSTPRTEIGAVYMFLAQTLAAHAPLVALVGTRLGEHPQPPEVACPHVAWQVVDANDLMVVGNIRVWTNVLVQVMGWHEGAAMGPCEALAAEIDAALHGARAVVGAAGIVLDCKRERPVFLPPTREEGDGKLYRQGGGEYRVYARRAT